MDDYVVGKDFVVALRGEVPSKCDFCYQPKPLEELEPEEAGDWVCHDCLKRWDESDARDDVYQEEKRKRDDAYQEEKRKDENH